MEICLPCKVSKWLPLLNISAWQMLHKSSVWQRLHCSCTVLPSLALQRRFPDLVWQLPPPAEFLLHLCAALTLHGCPVVHPTTNGLLSSFTLLQSTHILHLISFIFIIAHCKLWVLFLPLLSVSPVLDIFFIKFFPYPFCHFCLLFLGGGGVHLTDILIFWPELPYCGWDFFARREDPSDCVSHLQLRVDYYAEVQKML